MKKNRTLRPATILLIISAFLVFPHVGLCAEDITTYLDEISYELTTAADLDPLVSQAGNRTLTLLGESTHGTAEYYIWRDRISRRLISEKGYNFIVVEGDWPSFYQINLYVKGLAHQDRTAEELLRENFNRWPPWMWANAETAALAEWLKEFNSGKPEDQRVGIYGMDVYSKEESINEVRDFFANQDDEEFRQIASNYDCFSQFEYDGSNYARAIFQGFEDCSAEVKEVVDFLLTKRNELVRQCPASFFNAKQNAYIVKNAEKHFRSAIGRGPESWNYRVLHMEATVYRLLDHYGPEAKGIVWAHNTHIGDARATPMYSQGSYNIGQLAREKLGRENVFAVGFGCYKGSVLAGSSWGSQMLTMNIPEAASESVEALFKSVPKRDFYLLFDDKDQRQQFLSEVRGHRAIGVVYNPRQEYPGNYVPTVLTDRYDAFIFIEETTPLNPLH